MNKYVVHTTNGSIRGIPKLSILHTEYISFQKIPYAQPPIGKLRFRVRFLITLSSFPHLYV